jgi:RNA polymerase sigma-70 factor, ECF subfamily
MITNRTDRRGDTAKSKKVKTESDPSLDGPRKPDMLTQDHHMFASVLEPAPSFEAGACVVPLEKTGPSRPQRRSTRPRICAKGPTDVTSPSTDSPSDQTQWMLKVRDQRDKAAFSALFDHFAPRLKGMVMRSGASSAQAEDVVQEVMLKVWRKAHLFDPERAQVSAWIYQIARNQQTDHFRKNARPVPEALKTPEPPEPDASHVIGLEQEVQHLKRAMAALSPDQRQMVEQAYMGELSHSEISEATGLPLGTIKSRIRLALEKLRHEMKGARS